MRPRVLLISALSIGIALAASVVARLLGIAIAFVTNIAFYGRISTTTVSPADHHLGLFVLVVPVLGGLVVGVMARYGSAAIRGHGIPEAMEQVLFNESRIPARLTLLKPLSAAIAIGTGGPFGAEGPIIATGGALGSLVGQVASVTADERKTLLCAGAAAGMTATFGTPIAAVMLAVELLLFEYRGRSLVPVALACAVAAGVRGATLGFDPVFPMPAFAAPSSSALLMYATLGALMGFAASLVTRAVYAVEDAFARLPIHWMWWPALGGIAVGVVGYYVPRSLGVGYDNIEAVLGGQLVGNALLLLFVGKLASWLVALGSGTSGGTLAPLLTIGGALGAIAGALVPGLDPRLAALVGMAAMFAGASHAPLASLLFAFEATRQSTGILPLLAGVTAAYLVSTLVMRSSIMTEKIGRRGRHISSDLTTDPLVGIRVREVATTKGLLTLGAKAHVSAIREVLEASKHGGFPVVDEARRFLGIVTRHDIDAARDADAAIESLLSEEASAAAIDQNASLRDAADAMARLGVGRLAMIDDDGELAGILSRRDVSHAYRRVLEQARISPPTIRLRTLFARAR